MRNTRETQVDKLAGLRPSASSGKRSGHNTCGQWPCATERAWEYWCKEPMS